MSLRYRATGDAALRMGVRGLTRRPFVLTFVALGTIELLRLVVDPRPADLLVLVLVALVGLLAIREREAVADTEGTRRTEAESFARILRALSRSVSPDAIVAAIVEELGAGTGADHVAVVRRRPESRVLESVLSSTRPGAPTSRTSLPLSELDDPAEGDAQAALAVAASAGRRLTAIAIDPDPEGDPQLVPLGIAADRLAWAGAGARDGLAWEAAPAPVVAPLPTSPRSSRRPPQATSLREGADQRIADRIATRVADAYGLSNVLAAPLRVDGQTEGAIVVSRRTSEPWPASAHRILEAAATEASAALTRVYSLREAEARASTDALTGLPEPALLRRVPRPAGEAPPGGGPGRRPDDRHRPVQEAQRHVRARGGRPRAARGGAGDRQAVREDDVPARFGGEEFAVLLRNPSPEVAVEVGERVRRAVSSLDLRRLGVPGRERLGRRGGRDDARRRPRRRDRRGRPGPLPGEARRARPGRRRVAGEPSPGRPAAYHSGMAPDPDDEPVDIDLIDADDPDLPEARRRAPTNGDLARIFHEMGDILEVKGEIKFKTVAYHRAADAIARAPFDVASTYAAGDRRPIPGVGQAIGDKIVELATTGHMAAHERLRAEIPASLVDLLRIPGVGPQTVRVRLRGPRDRDARGPAAGRRGGHACAASRASPRAPSSGSSRASSSSSRGRSGCCSTAPGDLRRPRRAARGHARASGGSSRRARSAGAARRSATSTCSSRPTTPTPSSRGSPGSASSSGCWAPGTRRPRPSCCAARRWT